MGMTAIKLNRGTRSKRDKKPPKRSSELKIVSDLSGIKKPQKYLEFITFMAIPDVLRAELLEVKTEGDFAKKFLVNKNTLTDWKKRIGFWEDVIAVRKDFFRARTANVILALETKSLDPAKVQGQDVRILLTYTGEYTEKVENEHKIHPELAAALEKIGKVLT